LHCISNGYFTGNVAHYIQNVLAVAVSNQALNRSKTSVVTSFLHSFTKYKDISWAHRMFQDWIPRIA